MKNIFLLVTIASFGIFALAGCGGKTSENTNTAANGNTAGKANNNANQNKETAKTVFKPVEISPDANKIIEFFDKVNANPDSWKGKEVSVTGYVTSTSNNPGVDGYSLGLKNDEMGGSDTIIGCRVKNGDIPEEIMGKAVEVKGIVGVWKGTGMTKYQVYLESCTLKQ